MIKHYQTTREKRKARMRSKIRGTSSHPRLCVFRSNLTIYAQLINDDKMSTIIGASDKQIAVTEKNKIKRAHALGLYLAAQAKKKNINAIVFDRSGYTYHGRVKAVAEGLREGGLKF